MNLDNDRTNESVFWFGVLAGFVVGALVGIGVSALAIYGTSLCGGGL